MLNRRGLFSRTGKRPRGSVIAPSPRDVMRATSPFLPPEPRLYPRLNTLLAGAVALLLAALMAPIGHASGKAAEDPGETIYLHGTLGSGKPLVATREDGMRVEGADAACVRLSPAQRTGRQGGQQIHPADHWPLSHPSACQQAARISTCLTLKAYAPIVNRIPMRPSPGQSARASTRKASRWAT